MVAIEPLEQRIAPASLVVSNTNDSGPGSLRQAILDANQTPAADEITIQLELGAVQRITLQTALPRILGSISIGVGWLHDGPLDVEIDGREVEEVANGFEFYSDKPAVASIHGLSIFGFKGNGVYSEGVSLQMDYCFIGVDAAGTTAIGNAGDGVHFEGAQAESGSPASSSIAYCVVSGNGGDGIDLSLGVGNSFEIQNSKIGTDITGILDLGNAGDGIRIDGAPASPAKVRDSIISGNGGYGAHVLGTSFMLSSCYVGVDATGSKAVGNTLGGLLVTGNTRECVIGGSLSWDGHQTVISGNGGHGIELRDAALESVSFFQLYVGVSKDGKTAVPNRGDGLLISGIGEMKDGGRVETCVISGNEKNGVEVIDSTLGRIAWSLIGASIEDAPLPNGENGIYIHGTTSRYNAENNVLSGNAGAGILVSDAAAQIEMYRNWVGVNYGGTHALPNSNGVVIDSIGSDFRIGSPVSEAFSANHIAGNTGDGILVKQAKALSIAYNDIGFGPEGSILPNGRNGISVAFAPDGLIRYNQIGGNVLDGIFVGAGSDGLQVADNRVGLVSGETGYYVVPNGQHGIHISGSNNVLIGSKSGFGESFSVANQGAGIYAEGTTGIIIRANGVGPGTLDMMGNQGGGIVLKNVFDAVVSDNWIAGNVGPGLHIISSSRIVAAGNRIGVVSISDQAVENRGEGILLESTSDTDLGGPEANQLNQVAYNTGAGVKIVGGSNNTIRNLSIFGNGAAGIHLVGTDQTVIDRIYIGEYPVGSRVGNSGPGILLEQSTGTVIGSDGPSLSNVIAGNHGAGIVVKSGSGSAFRNLEIYENEEGGIVLENVTDAVVSDSRILKNSGPGLHIISSSHVVAAGNRIGALSTLDQSIGNHGEGILLEDTSDTDLGGSEADEHNQIASSTGAGIKIVGGSNNTIRNLSIFGNGAAGIHLVGADQTVIDRTSIGVSPSGSLIGNSGPGVLLEQSTKTVIGSDGPSQSNVIAGNHVGGIVVKSGSGNTFRNLEMYANEGLAIDLGNDGATPNDSQDADSGANGLQNTADLSYAFDLGIGRAAIHGAMRSTPNTPYRIEFYTDSVDGGHAVSAGSIEVLTNVNGVVPFEYEIANGSAPYVKAIATNLSTGDSSEFSPHVEVVAFHTSLQISKDKKTATWVDVDGDLVTLKVNRPVLDAEDFVLAVEGDLLGERLVRLDLNDQVEVPKAAIEVSINSVPRKTDSGVFGNSRVDVGVIDAGERSLGNVFIDGDLTGLHAIMIHSFKAFSVGAAASVDPAITSLSEIRVLERLGSFTVAGDVVRTKITARNVGSVNIRGDFDESSLNVENRLASFSADNVLGRSLEEGGLIRARSIGSVRIDGDILGGEGGGSGIRATERIGAIRIAGDIAGYDAYRPVLIEASGATEPSRYAVASIFVKGDVKNTQILSGNPDLAGRSLGPIDVRGNWESSIAAASIDPGQDNLFGTLDDRLGGTVEGDPVIRSIARIARITIRGTVSGTEAAGDSFGFFAQRVGPVRIHGSLASAGVLAGTDDVRLLEVLTRQG